MTKYAKELWEGRSTILLTTKYIAFGTEHTVEHRIMSQERFEYTLAKAMEDQRKACAEALINSLTEGPGIKWLYKQEYDAILDARVEEIPS